MFLNREPTKQEWRRFLLFAETVFDLLIVCGIFALLGNGSSAMKQVWVVILLGSIAADIGLRLAERSLG